MSPLNIVIPMAGAGSRFIKEGFEDPKPLIPIHGIPMIRWVIENLKPKTKHRFIFICQKSHIDQYNLFSKLRVWAPGCEVVALTELTDGAARTVLKARHLIENNSPLMIANSDQYIDASIDDYLEQMVTRSLNGLIMTMNAFDSKWSFVKIDDKNLVKNVVEKQVISNIATVGIYNFLKGCDFVHAADTMISKNLRVNNEFYVAPVYNQLIAEGARVGVYNIGSEGAGMYGLGTPIDLRSFMALDFTKNLAATL